MDMIRWFDSIRLDDSPQVGGKGANLGELTAAGLPVPPGFVITSDAFLDAIDRSGARLKLRQVIDSADPDDPASLTACAQRAQELVHARRYPTIWPRPSAPPITAWGPARGWPSAPRGRARTARVRRLPA